MLRLQSSLIGTTVLVSSVCLSFAFTQDDAPAGDSTQDASTQDPPAAGDDQGDDPQPVVPNPALGGAGAGSGPQGSAREAMWYAPTEEDWKKPVLIRWQRTWEDALEVSQETGRPILICVNMDGEIASEHYAGIRYRQPEIAKIYEPYISVIASVYRHNPRDYDEQGRRIPCPRFGTVTCGEHIAIEPILHDQYFEGTRVAPRHIMIELDKKEAYDVYYAFDTESVFRTVNDGVADRVFPPIKPPGDRPMLDRVVSRNSEDREAVERAYLEGNAAKRRQLMRAVVAAPKAKQAGLLRLAIFDLDLELNRLARQALAASNDPASVDLIALALRAPMPAEDREALVVALERIGVNNERARNLAVVHRGLGARSENVDVASWSSALGTAEPIAAYDQAAVERKLERGGASRKSQPADPAASLSIAEATLAMAIEPDTVTKLAGSVRRAREYTKLLFEDARRAGREAEALGARGWRVDSVLALTAYYLGDVEEARMRAAAAVNDLPKGDASWNTMAVLGIFAESRREDIDQAAREKREWPAHWVADVHSAYSVLAAHPLGTDDQVAMHHDFLRRFGAAGQAVQALDRGLARFPESALLHARLRARILEEKGVAGLEPAYERMIAGEDVAPNLVWFAGYASFVAAEFHRRGSAPDRARGAYTRSIAHFDRYVLARPEDRATGDHYAALSLAGRARLTMESGDDDGALEDLLASFTRRPQAAGVLDGLNLSPADTSRTLMSHLKVAEKAEQVARLQAALDKLDPDDLDLPDYEKPGAGTGPQGLRGRRGGRRRAR
jgi:tetratricopeptide (TPR) repeat protein